MKVTREHAIKLWDYLQSKSGLKMKPKLAYSLFKNKKLLDAEIDVIQEVQKEQYNKIPESYMEYENKRIELCKDYADQDEDGKPILVFDEQRRKEVYAISKEKQEEFTEKFEKLQDENKEAIEEFTKLQEGLHELFKEETDIEFYPISVELFSDDISPEEMELLEPLLKFSGDE